MYIPLIIINIEFSKRKLVHVTAFYWLWVMYTQVSKDNLEFAYENRMHIVENLM